MDMSVLISVQDEWAFECENESRLMNVCENECDCAR